MINDIKNAASHYDIIGLNSWNWEALCPRPPAWRCDFCTYVNDSMASEYCTTCGKHQLTGERNTVADELARRFLQRQKLNQGVEAPDDYRGYGVSTVVPSRAGNEADEAGLCPYKAEPLKPPVVGTGFNLESGRYPWGGPASEAVPHGE